MAHTDELTDNNQVIAHEENANGFSDDLRELDQQISDADGIILSLAEHNGAYTAAFKNAFDWLSRIESKTWRDKPMLLLSSSPGGRGGQSVMDMALDRFPRHNANIVYSMTFPSFYDNFKEGEVVNPDLHEDLMKGMNLFQEAL